MARRAPLGDHRAMRSLVLVLAMLAGCGDDAVSSAEEARRAYLGLDRAVELALNLGLAGYSAASSANIPAQTGNGEVAGTLTVTGQVDQGTSDNKELRLETAFAGYEDRLAGAIDGGSAPESDIVYDSDPAALPQLDLSLRNITTAGTFTGTFAGRVSMSGTLRGDVTLALTLMGNLQMGASGLTRVPGTTRITGTATSGYGVYTIDITR